MRLRAVGLPELRGRRGTQSVDAAAGFIGAHGPGGEGGDFAEVGGLVMGVGGAVGCVCVGNILEDFCG